MSHLAITSIINSSLLTSTPDTDASTPVAVATTVSARTLAQDGWLLLPALPLTSINNPTARMITTRNRPHRNILPTRKTTATLVPNSHPVSSRVVSSFSNLLKAMALLGSTAHLPVLLPRRLEIVITGNEKIQLVEQARSTSVDFRLQSLWIEP